MIFGTSSDRSSILPKTTLIEGAPGIGKTVVAKEIASRWAQNKMLPDIKLLLLIYLKKTDINQIKNFEELMQVCHENKDLTSCCANYFVKTQGRPYITAHLHRYCNCRVEIMGFAENDRLSYFEENLSYKEFQKLGY